VDQTWTVRQVCSWSSQLGTPPTYGLRSRELPIDTWRLIWRTSSCAQADADADGRPGLPAPRAITSGAGASIRLG
jgi:hypothetical protein